MGEVLVTVSVQIFQDDEVEAEEEFQLMLHVPPLFDGRVSAGDQSTAIGVITAPDGKLHIIGNHAYVCSSQENDAVYGMHIIAGTYSL